MQSHGAPPAKRARLTQAQSRANTQQKRPPMHSGRWTPEEEQYVEGMIAEFNAGFLPITEGTTLRSFLAKMLNCNPKRVSKKYDGNPIYNGKSAFVRAETALPPTLACERQENLLELERKFREALLTMQRVESRLQSLTGHMFQKQQSSTSTAAASMGPTTSTSTKKESPTMHSWPSGSAVSSLTDDDEEEEAAAMEEGNSTVVAQVSQTDGGSARSKAASTIQEGRDDEAASASEMLLQLNASKPRALAAAGRQSPVHNETPQQNAGLLLKRLYESQAQIKETQQVTDKICEQQGSAVNNRKRDNCDGDGTGTLNQGNLQTMLRKLNDIRQQQRQQQETAAAPTRPDLGSFLNLSSAPPARYESPIMQPKDTRQSLQDLLQLIQRPGSAPAVAPQQQQQQQVASAPPAQQQNTSSSLQTILKALQQQQQQQQQQAPPPPPPQASTNSTNECLQNLLQRLTAPTPAPPAPAAQQPLAGLLQSMMQSKHAPQGQQQQQQTNSNIQGALNNMMSQLSQQQQPVQQSNNSGNSSQEQQFMQALVSSLKQSVQNHQQQQQQQQQAPKPQEAPARDNDSLQRLLAQLQGNRSN